MDLAYTEQLKEKQKTLTSLLSSYAKPEPIIGMENPDFYRNKVHAVFGLDSKRKPTAGVYEARTHRIVPIDSCFLENQKASAIIRTIKGLLPSFKLKVYDEDSGYGLLRHVLIRTARATGQIMVVLVLSSPILPSKNNFVKALRKEHPEITTIVINVNDRKTSMVLGDREQAIYGKGYIEDILCGKTFKLSPRSFYQVNPIQTQRLYETAISYAGLTGEETILDAYSGIGTIGIIASEKAKQVISVELNPDAVRDAIFNAKKNEIKNIQFYQKDAGQFMLQLAAQKEKIDVVFMDPPRAGSDEAFLTSVVTCRPQKIVYISCNPETLARDLKFLTGKGYKVKRIQGVDMFPHTEHVETVVKLVRKKADAYVDITVDMDELDLTASEAKATYQEIKDYILKKYDVKVSSLYIAQVKQKHGIIERECYNKSRDEKQPQCPAKKEKLIEEALRHFKMIS